MFAPGYSWFKSQNAVHAVRSFGCRPILGPYFWSLLTNFWFHTGFFFSFLCIWDVAHLNCHPFLPSFNHFYPFSIPHIELSRHGDPEKAGVMWKHNPHVPYFVTHFTNNMPICSVGGKLSDVLFNPKYAGHVYKITVAVDNLGNIVWICDLMLGTSADVMIWDQHGSSRTHGQFFDFEIGAHDGA